MTHEEGLAAIAAARGRVLGLLADPARLARHLAGLAAMPDAWLDARMPGFRRERIEDLGDDWRAALLDLALRLAKRR